MTRQTKTPRQRAEEGLGIAERRHKKALRAHADATAALTNAEIELDEARRLHDYAKAHPALQTPTTTTNQEGTPA